MGPSFKVTGPLNARMGGGGRLPGGRGGWLDACLERPPIGALAAAPRHRQPHAGGQKGFRRRVLSEFGAGGGGRDLVEHPAW